MKHLIGFPPEDGGSFVDRAFIAAAGVEANYTVRLIWKREAAN